MSKKSEAPSDYLGWANAQADARLARRKSWAPQPEPLSDTRKIKRANALRRYFNDKRN